MLFPNDENIPGNNQEEANGGKLFKRLQVPFVDQSQRFRFKATNDYSKQFAHIYSSRLAEMRELLTKTVQRKWGEKYPIKKMFELREENPEKCIIIGTLYKHQSLKPSILREISEETQLAPQPIRFNFSDDLDKLILEDELQRIRLFGKLDCQFVVTGIVCAVLGYEDGDGKFIAEDYLYNESGPQKPLKDLSVSPILILISGLDQSSQKDTTQSLELFQQWLFGNVLSFDKTNDWESANVVRIIVAGNSVRTSLEKKQQSNQTRQPESEMTLRAVTSVDNIISNWIQSCAVDIMSGEFDPSNFMLPQQPMHHCMFPKCVKHQQFRGVPNPYDCQLTDRRIIGTSGQNIDDILRYSKINNRLQALRNCLEWSHISPTSPDTLPCFPYFERDPFILNECPHIFFCGNSMEFQTELHEMDSDLGLKSKKTRLVCVPSFSNTQSVAVVNLRTLECNELKFHLTDFENDTIDMEE